MRVRVLLFGPLAARLNRREEVLELDAPATAADVYRHYAGADAVLGALGRDVLLAVNAEFAAPDTPLAERDEVALLPPMSGGSSGASPEEPSTASSAGAGAGAAPGGGPAGALLGAAGVASSSGAGSVAAAAASPGPDRGGVELVRGPIALDRLRQMVAAPGHGGVVVFEGVTRADVLDGQPVLYLEYEAYEEMALRRMRELAAEARQRFAIGAVAMAHRLGRVVVGETSVAIAVGAPHRGPAFAACAWAITELKRSVPIWKREHTAEGHRWAEGTPFAGEPAGQS